VTHDTTANLIARVDDKALTVTLDRDLDAVPAALAGFDAALEPPRRLTVRYRAGETRVEVILDAIRAVGLPILDVSTREADLSAIFPRLVREGHATKEETPAHATRLERAAECGMEWKRFAPGAAVFLEAEDRGGTIFGVADEDCETHLQPWSGATTRRMPPLT
jgi:hypothetical protein